MKIIPTISTSLVRYYRYSFSYPTLILLVREALTGDPFGTFHRYLEPKETIHNVAACIFDHFKEKGCIDALYITISCFLLNPFPTAAEDNLDWFMKDAF